MTLVVPLSPPRSHSIRATQAQTNHHVHVLMHHRLAQDSSSAERLVYFHRLLSPLISPPAILVLPPPQVRGHGGGHRLERQLRSACGPSSPSSDSFPVSQYLLQRAPGAEGARAQVLAPPDGAKCCVARVSFR